MLGRLTYLGLSIVASTASGSLFDFKMPCNGPAIGTNNLCSDAVLDCQEVLPTFKSNFESILGNVNKAELQHEIELDIAKTETMDNPKGAPIDSTVCPPNQSSSTNIGGTLEYRNPFGKECGDFVHAMDYAGDIKAHLGNPVGNSYSGAGVNALRYGVRFMIRQCTANEVMSEFMSGKLKITSPACLAGAQDISNILDATATLTHSATNGTENVPVCQLHNVKNEKDFSLRRFCENQENEAFAKEHISSKVRACNMSKMGSTLEAAAQKIIQCEQMERTARRDIAAVAESDSPFRQIVTDTMLYCKDKAIDKAESNGGTFLNPTIGEAKDKGKEEFYNCQSRELFRRVAEWANPLFPSNAACAI